VLDQLIDGLGAIAAPPRCGACAEPCSAGAPLCLRCSRELSGAPGLLAPGPPGVDLLCSAGPYEGVVRRIVVSLKFARRIGLAAPAAEAMLRSCPTGELHGELVAVPASPLRWRWRGFDPAEELAVALSGATGLRLSPCLRREHGPRQARRSRLGRLREPPRISLRAPAPARALLVDDVHTTGATLRSCAGALRAGGCRRIVALALALA